MKPRLTRAAAAAVLAAAALALPAPAAAFCGFYVGKADAKLYNKASQVVLVRDGVRTAISMANDYRGELKQFALVVPVPVVLKREQIHVGDRKLFERIDAFTAPRLVEYFDEDPCAQRFGAEMDRMAAPASAVPAGGPGRRDAKALGVTIEARYTVGEYDILILGAKESSGLETWLRQEGYRIPKGAAPALAPYIKQKMKFFVAKVNLEEQAKTGFSGLRPIQFAYEDARFMLPIRLGMINADGPQDLIVYVLTRKGRVESANYKTLKVPSDVDIPLFVKGDFGKFYTALFDKAVEGQDRRGVFTEYFWDMGWCDPCAADPLSPEELRKLGVMWLDEEPRQPGLPPGFGRRSPRPWMGGGAVPVKVTRLHARYDWDRFPEDLVFQETADQANFQGRYVLRHPWKGGGTCAEARTYKRDLWRRQNEEAQTLAKLTGWDLEDIKRRMSLGAEPAKEDWYKSIFR